MPRKVPPKIAKKMIEFVENNLLSPYGFADYLDQTFIVDGWTLHFTLKEDLRKGD